MLDRYCCKVMQNVLSEGKSSLGYYAPIRSYYIHDEYTPSARPIIYCPWCASKLPESLYNKQEEILEKEYGLVEIWEGGKDFSRIPAEFLTDEWWKKRGL